MNEYCYDDLMIGDLPKANVLNPEIEQGNTEYKYKLTNLIEEQLKHRITQLNWRLNEGHDIAVYQIGVEDDGNPLGISRNEMLESIGNLEKMAKIIGCTCTVKHIYQGIEGFTAKIIMKRVHRTIVNPVQTHVALAGDFECGKSTLIGVLSTGLFDNGQGLARMQVFQHNHEICSGRTSSISQHNLHFDEYGQLLNVNVEASRDILRNRTQFELADLSHRIVSFIDLAGHSKYLKTTLHGLVARAPDHCLLCISAKRGVQNMTTEHLGVAFALKLPLAIAITKCDLVSETVQEQLIATLIRMLSTSKRKLKLISEIDQIKSLTVSSSDDNNSEPVIVPVFLTSSVTGKGLSTLRQYLFHLSTNGTNWSNERKNSTFVRVIGSYKCQKHINFNIPISHDDDDETLLQEMNNDKSVNKLRLKVYSNTLGVVGAPQSSPLTKYLRNCSDDEKIISDINCDSQIHPNFSDNELLINKENVMADNNDSQVIIFLTSIKSGDLHIGQSYYFGPFSVKGEFIIAKVKSIRVNNVPVMSTVAGQTATVLLTHHSHVTDTYEDNLKFEKSVSQPINILKLSNQIEYSNDYNPDIVPSIQSSIQNLASFDNFYPTPLLSESNVVSSSSITMPLLRRNRSNSMPDLHFNVSSSSIQNPKTDLMIHNIKTSSVDDEILVKLNTSTMKDSNENNLSLSTDLSEMTGHLRLRSDTIKFDDIRRRSVLGLVLLPLDTKPVAHWEFEAELLVLNHPSKIRINYEPVVHIGCIKQSARIIAMYSIPITALSDNPTKPHKDDSRDMNIAPSPRHRYQVTELSNGSKAICRFRFLYYPEYITEGSTMLIREGRTRGVGHVIKPIPNIQTPVVSLHT